jgi:AraC-like DNA-binding protein
MTMTKAIERITPCMLAPEVARKKYEQMRLPPSPDIGVFVQYYWGAVWNLRGCEPYVHESLPDPCMHMVFEPGWSRVVGVTSGKFRVQLEKDGRIFGICFKPGAFYPLVKTPMVAYTDRTFLVSDVFGEAGAALRDSILATEEDHERLRIAEAFLREILTPPDENDRLIRTAVDLIIDDPDITKVNDLVERTGVNKRKLQRLFIQYVGVSPKAVIQRYRLNDAADHLLTRPATNATRVAVEYGYFDQSHFIKDFKQIVGQTPSRFAKGSGAAGF